MSETRQKIIIAAISACLSAPIGGCVATAGKYVQSAATLEPRMAAIEKSLARLEVHFYIAPERPAREDRR